MHLFLSNVSLFYYLFFETLNCCAIHLPLWEIKDFRKNVVIVIVIIIIIIIIVIIVVIIVIIVIDYQ